MNEGGDAKATQVYVALENLGKTAEELEVLIDRLERNLVSVLVPEGPTEGEEPDTKPSQKVILAGTLTNYNTKLQLLVGKLKSIENRLEL